MNRRQFTADLSALAGWSLFGAAGFNGCAASDARGSGESFAPIGLQLYTVRDAMAENVERTLADVASVGYTEVEFADYFGLTARHLADLLQSNGLAAPGTHSSTEAFRTDAETTIAFAKEVGHEFVIVPWINADERTPDGYRAIADAFNRWGEQCRQAGVGFGYHNHDFEFSPLADGRNGFDILLDETEHDLVTFELDLYWIAHAGQDALRYLTEHSGRFRLCHVKDMDRDGNMVDVGAGRLDFPRSCTQRGKPESNTFLWSTIILATQKLRYEPVFVTSPTCRCDVGSVLPGRKNRETEHHAMDRSLSHG